MQTPTIIETDLREILAEMNKKLDTISKDVNQVQIRLAIVLLRSLLRLWECDHCSLSTSTKLFTQSDLCTVRLLGLSNE
jgi:hypothetical protein